MRKRSKSHQKKWATVLLVAGLLISLGSMLLLSNETVREYTSEAFDVGMSVLHQITQTAREFPGYDNGPNDWNHTEDGEGWVF